jgi:hypothetical protein
VVDILGLATALRAAITIIKIVFVFVEKTVRKRHRRGVHRTPGVKRDQQEHHQTGSGKEADFFCWFRGDEDPDRAILGASQF